MITFPDETKHLPEQLKSRAIYSTTKTEKPTYSTLGKVTHKGFRLAMSRLLSNNK